MNPIDPFDARRQQDQQRQRQKVAQALIPPQAAPQMPNPQRVMALGRNFSDMLAPAQSMAPKGGMTRPMRGMR